MIIRGWLDSPSFILLDFDLVHSNPLPAVLTTVCAIGYKRGFLGDAEARSVIDVDASHVSQPACQHKGSSSLTEDSLGFVRVRHRLFVDRAKFVSHWSSMLSSKAFEQILGNNSCFQYITLGVW